MFRLALAFPLFFAPSFAAAQCLTAANMDAGIIMEFESGTISHISNGENDMLVDKGQNEEDSWEILSYGSIFEISVTSRTAGYWSEGGYSIEYDFSVADIFPLQTGAIGGGTETYIDAHSTDDVIFSYSVHAGEPLEVSGCTYETQNVYLTRLADFSELSTMELIYISDLEVGYVSRSKWYQDDPSEYTLVTLSAAN